MGLMPDGGIESEAVILNEISMWSGSKADYSNPAAGQSLPTIRELLFEGRNREAQEMMYESFIPNLDKGTASYGTYQYLGDLKIDYIYPSSGDVTNYKRGLDLKKGVAYTTFERDGATFYRRYFASRDRDVLIIHLSSSELELVGFSLNLTRPECEAAESCESGAIKISGELESGQEDVEGLKYSAYIDIECIGDDKTTYISDGGVITVTNCDEAWIVISAATTFFEGDKYDQRAEEILNEALTGDAREYEEEAIRSYQALYDRAKLTIKGNDEISLLPTNQRIEAFQHKDDPSLAALYYNYARYLMISSTRVGSLPPNLQGLWARTTQTPWNGDYHTNINVQMNHWGVEPGNLSELHLPLIELTKRLVESGKESAKSFYGEDAQGWVAHMMTNIWEFTAPGFHPKWGATNTGGAWLCAHLWEHYLYTNDREYLEEIYDVIKGAAEFFLSAMVVDPNSGWLVTAPTSSPENTVLVGDDPTPVSICMAPTMDVQLVRELFSNVISASKILGVDADFAKSLAKACKMMPPHKISEDGYLQEWLEDYKQNEPHHRHVSHLYGLHPGNQISVVKTPELADACRETLELRGDGGTGWSRAWKMNFWARLADEDRAYKLFKNLLTPAYTAENPNKHTAGSFPNLFCSHAPFQIDGNWGGASGVSEMLIQSQDGFINLLPALPIAWREGELEGFRVRGGATISLKWSDGIASEATFCADNNGSFKFKTPDFADVITVEMGGKTKIYKNKEYITLNAIGGEAITLKFE